MLANCGAAVTNVLLDVERVTKVVVLGEGGAELVELEGEEEDDDKGEEAEEYDGDAEFAILGGIAEETVGGDEEAVVLLVTDGCVDTEGGGMGVPLDDAFDTKAGLKPMEKAFAGQAQAQLHA